MRSMSPAVESQLDLVVVFRELRERQVDQTQRLLGFETQRVILFGYEQREEHGFHAAFFGARQIELSIRNALADIAAVVELPVDRVYVGIEHEGLFV